MGRKPFFREFDGWWYAYVTIGSKRKQVKLAKGKDREQEAYRAFCRLMAEDPVSVSTTVQMLCCTVCDLFLQHSEKHHEPDTFRWYKSFLEDFCSTYPRLAVADLKPFHVNRWLDQHDGWGQGSRRHAIICVKRAFSWADDEGLISTSPIRKLKKPSAGRRERILTAAEKQEILAVIKDRQFREFVFAMQETGCRPSEVARVTAADVDLELGVWILQKHKTRKKTNKPRVIYLTPAMVELTKRLMIEQPVGTLFRSHRKNGVFTRNAIRIRFRQLRKKLPHLKGVVSYCYRHTFCTDALA
ncbi:MAG TPA: tyrosine-type recombinase/integrase, partial [Gemmataceae bacterium]|nr:tyrosine-type recombinase/integrase [Gemmataceae bacterium]